LQSWRLFYFLKNSYGFSAGLIFCLLNHALISSIDLFGFLLKKLSAGATCFPLRHMPDLPFGGFLYDAIRHLSEQNIFFFNFGNSC
jgi:hypothetical protein